MKNPFGQMRVINCQLNYQELFVTQSRSDRYLIGMRDSPRIHIVALAYNIDPLYQRTYAYLHANIDRRQNISPLGSLCL